jgi:XapX domain-containing protein
MVSSIAAGLLDWFIRESETLDREGHKMIKIVAGMVLGLVIGASCRWFDIPLPGPPKLVGAFLIVSITFGYLVTDKLITTKFSSKGPALTRDMCGGPNGEVISKRVS